MDVIIINANKQWVPVHSPTSSNIQRTTLTGNEASIPMYGCIGPRFSFTHYPRSGGVNGPGVALVRPIPDPAVPTVTFLGLVPRSCGGAGLALGTLGPVLGDVGTSTARVLVEVRRTTRQGRYEGERGEYSTWLPNWRRIESQQHVVSSVARCSGLSTKFV